MKATKKIVGAACALVAAVALSAGSTFAWFSQSGTVSATGMNVKATSSKNLVISTSSTGGWSTSVTLADPANAVKVLAPSSTVDAKNFFYVSNPENVNYGDGVTADGAVLAAATNPATISEATPGYYVTYDYYVKAESDTTITYSSIYVSELTITRATSTDDQSALAPSLRVAFTLEDGNTVILAPIAGGSASGYQGVKTAGTVGAETGAPTYEAVTLATAGATADLGELSTTAKKVTVTVWYEGQDSTCTSANSMNVEQLGISFKITAGATKA